MWFLWFCLIKHGVLDMTCRPLDEPSTNHRYLSIHCGFDFLVDNRKHLLGKIEKVKDLQKITGVGIIFSSIAIVLSFICLIILTILLLPLAGYKKMVNTYLRFKHNEDYGGLLAGIDNLWAIEKENSRHIINVLLLVKYGDPKDEIMPTVKRIFNEAVIYQFTSLRRQAFGYFYRLQNQVTANDLIKEWNLSSEQLSDKQLFDDAMSQISNTAMPMEDTACFELLACTKPIKFRNHDVNGTEVYPILIRIHHSVGDGIALLSFLLKNLCDERISVEEEMLKMVGSKKTRTEINKPTVLLDYVNSAIDILKKIARFNVYYFAPTTPADINTLHAPQLSGKQILTSYLEERPGYIEKIKSIKKRIPGSTFTDVILTAVSASFHEYFKQNANGIPTDISLSFVLRPLVKNLECKVTQTGEKEYKLGNNFSIGTLRLPIIISNHTKNPSTTLRDRLFCIKKEGEKLKNSADILVYYWQLRFLTNLLPSPVLNVILDINQTSTVIFSNLPGIHGVHIQGYKVQDIVFWVPTVGTLGVGLSILTYDNRFQMGLVVDKVLISESGQARSILDNVIKHIDKFNEELNSYNIQ